MGHPEAKPQDRVLLLHGIGAAPRQMAKLERAIAAAGYDTLNPGYPSRRHPLEQLADGLLVHQNWLTSHPGQTHIVTNSMGGLLARVYLARHRPPNLGRVVMIGPPNGGSEIADLLAKNPLYRWFYGPAGQQLRTMQPASFRESLGKVDYPLGVIAGDRAIYPVGWLIMPKPNDGRVAVARTRLADMTDHVTVHATHFGLRLNPQAIRMTLEFLRAGRFGES
jgi:pimeloyl-ACP methyl ester carboxylesterase